MLTVIYNAKTGEAVADGKATEMSEKLIWASHLMPCHYTTSSRILVDAVRLAVKKGEIEPERVKFIYSSENAPDVHIIVNKDGRLNPLPKGFCDALDIIQEQLINW